ncbi:UNVERIFIED_CONTAM: hypothetical protein Sradi_0753900, partial [Sesamum radiatum]
VAQQEDDSSQALIHVPVEGLSHTCANNSLSCVANITFTDEDLLLGSTPHNRPLFVTGCTREQRVNRVSLDGGSVVNILLLRTMKEFGISMYELEHSRAVQIDLIFPNHSERNLYAALVRRCRGSNSTTDRSICSIEASNNLYTFY